jgi:putative ABC transport system ATP-binding protein
MQKLTQFFSRLPLVNRWTTPNEPTPFATKLPTIITPKGPVLVGENLTRSFGTGGTKTFALKDVSIEFQKGELNLLMGPSGSGKSTLLAVLSALLRPDGGTVTANGQDVWSMSNAQMEKFRLRHCSYIFQGYNLFPAFTARQQLEVVLQWGEGASQREARKRADHVLGQLGLSHRADLRPQALSGGEKQRVAIARALVKNPSFIFADEPTSALDWENGQAVMDLLKECAKLRGATVIVVAHDHRLEGYADKIFHMADGKLVKHAEPKGSGTVKPAAGKSRVRISDFEFANV